MPRFAPQGEHRSDEDRNKRRILAFSCKLFLFFFWYNTIYNRVELFGS